MHYLKVAKHPLAWVAIVTAIVAVLLTSAGNNASAGGPFDFTGVTCMDVSLAGNINTKIISRIEPTSGGWNVTSVAYDGDIDGDTVPDGPPTTDSCVEKTEPGSMTAGIEFQDVDIHDRPSALATLENGNTTLDWVVDCQFNAGISQWVLTKFSINVSGTLGSDTGTLDAWLDASACPEDPLGAPTVSLTVASVVRDVGGGGTSDWDGDGRTDWDELAAVGSGTGPDGCDPFNPADNLCGPIGGVAELPDAAAAPLDAASSSSNNTGLIAAAAVAAMAAVVLGGSAWYVQRRRLR